MLDEPTELLRCDLVMWRITRIDIGTTQQFEAALGETGVAWPGFYQPRCHLADARLQITISCASGAHVPLSTLRAGSRISRYCPLARSSATPLEPEPSGGSTAPRLRARPRSTARGCAQPSPAARVSAGCDDRWRGAGQGPAPELGCLTPQLSPVSRASRVSRSCHPFTQQRGR